MFSDLQQFNLPEVATPRGAGHGDIAPDTAMVAATSTLLALGADLRACLEQPDSVSIGDFAAVVERLRGEFNMLCGEANLISDQDDNYAGLFLDQQNRELSQSDIGLIESLLKNIG
jgi:hypothetical protein